MNVELFIHFSIKSQINNLKFIIVAFFKV